MKNLNIFNYKKILSIIFAFGIFIGVQSQNSGFEMTPITSYGWTIQTGNIAWTVGTTNPRSGKYRLDVTQTTTAQKSISDTGFLVTVPSTGTNYIHIIGYAYENSSFTDKVRMAAKSIDGGTSITGTATKVGASWTRLTAKGVATNGKKYYPQFISSGSGSSGGDKYAFDDIFIYTSTNSTTDVTKPNSPTNFTVATNSNNNVFLKWTDGTDANSGIGGVLILRTDGSYTSTIPTVLPQVYYSTDSTKGLTSFVQNSKTWTVIHNGNALGSYTDLTNSGSSYTYVVYMRDKAYNYSSGVMSIVTKSATISPNADNFDLRMLPDKIINLTINDAVSISSIVDSRIPSNTLVLNTDYTIIDSTLTINSSYLNTVIPNVNDTIVLTINFLKGLSSKITYTAVKLSNQSEILNFTFSEQIGNSIIDSINRKITILVPTFTDLTQLNPTITISDSATVNPESGVITDFTTPVIYTVTAEDGVSISNWEVTVIKKIAVTVSEFASTSVKIKWDVVPGAVDYRIKYFEVGTSEVFYKIDSIHEGLLIDQSILVTLKPLTQYYVCITYWDGVDSAEYSDPVLFQTVNQNMTFSRNFENRTAVVSWLPYEGAINYRIRYWKEGEDMTTTHKVATTNLTTTSISSLIEGETYNFQVRADFGNGFTSYSLIFSYTIPSINISFSENAGTSLKLDWNEVTNATQYCVKYWKNGDDVNTASALLYNATNSVALSNLIEDTYYNFQLRINFGSGYSSYGNTFTVHTIKPVINITQSTKNTIIIKCNGYQNVTKYRLYYNELNSTTINSLVSDSNTFVITNIKSNTTYEFQSRVDFGNGFTGYSSKQSYTSPSENLTFKENAGTSVKVKCEYSNLAVNYRIRYWKEGEDMATTHKIVTSANDSALVYNLQQNTEYNFQYRIEYSDGYGSYGTIYKLVTANPIIEFDSVETNSVIASWTPYPDAIAYRIVYCDLATNTTNTITTTNTSAKISSLKIANAYSVKVRPDYGQGFIASYSIPYNVTTSASKNLLNDNLTIITRNDELKIYPNPFNKEINISIFLNSESNSTWQFIDVSGRIVFSNSTQLSEGFNTVNISTENLSKGIYMLMVKTNEFQKSFKLLKSN